MSGTNSSIIGKLIVTALVIAWAVASMVPFGDTPFEDYIKTRATANQQEFVQVLKTETSKWLKTQTRKFPLFYGWSNGYAAFSYCERDKEMIRRYIMNQKAHHKKQSFKAEYEHTLKEWKIDPQTDLFLKDD